MKTAALRLFSPLSLAVIATIALLYLLLTAYLLNYHFLWTTFTGSFPLSYKITIAYYLFIGSFTDMSPLSVLFHVIASLLIGINIILISETISLLEHMGKVKLSIGGATIISVITTGCSSCGLSLLSVFGLSASISFLPFHGLEIQILTTLLLFGSAGYMIYKLMQSGRCQLV